MKIINHKKISLKFEELMDSSWLESDYLLIYTYIYIIIYNKQNVNN